MMKTGITALPANHLESDPPQRVPAQRVVQNGSHLPDTHRLPPQSEDAEKGVISSFVNDPATVAKLCVNRGITKRFFHLPHHALIFDTLMFMAIERFEIDVITLTEQLRGAKSLDQVGGAAYIADLFTFLPTAANVGNYLDIIEEKHTRREVIRLMNELSTRAYDEQEDVTDLLEHGKGEIKNIAEHRASADIGEVLLPRRFDATNPPSKPVPVWTLGDAVIATPGNLMAVQAKSKAGKTAFLGGMIGCTMSREGDFFGLSSANPSGKALIHLDTEQSPYDHYQVLMRSLLRGGLQVAPAWLRSYCVTDLPLQARLSAVRQEMERAAAEHGGVFAVIIDGLGDLCRSLNDDVEAFGLVDELHQLAIRFHCVIVCVLHENPTSDQGKTRGHLGSQLERKAETNLRLEKDPSGVTVIFAGRARSAHIPKDKGRCFQWNDELGRHVSTDGEFAPKGEKKGSFQSHHDPNLLVEACEVSTGIPIAELRDQVRLEHGIAEASFYRFKAKLLKEGKIVQKDGQLYRAIKPKA